MSLCFTPQHTDDLLQLATVLLGGRLGLCALRQIFPTTLRGKLFGFVEAFSHNIAGLGMLLIGSRLWRLLMILDGKLTFDDAIQAFLIQIAALLLLVAVFFECNGFVFVFELKFKSSLSPSLSF